MLAVSKIAAISKPAVPRHPAGAQLCLQVQGINIIHVTVVLASGAAYEPAAVNG
jgi:hypothetical protein